ncbi:MAG: HlyC/CorC family transporter [Verrucomicrobiales bacterium]|nr:HlyC/CorC family transporter [Verrucomicrobiales bacterium]MCP5525988.1 HlyC/CorC family transporter [Verrucomicrobiales bacterium]
MSWDAVIALLLKILAVAALVLLNGFFVAAEFALVKIRETQLDTLIAQGRRAARITRRVLRNLDSSLSACQLGITLASLALGWVGEPIFSALLHPLWEWSGFTDPAREHLRETVAVVVGFSAITFLHITAGEQAPKWLAIQKPLPTSLVVARPLEWFHRISYPFIWLLNHASLWLLRRLGLQMVGEHDLAHSEDELRLLLAAGARRTGATALGRAIVLNAFDLRRRIAREVMQPRREIVGFDVADPIESCLALAEQTRFSRFPLFEDGDLDRTVGVVHVKDLYTRRHQAQVAADLLPVAREIIYVPETARLEQLLELFLERRLHFGIVVDEYGSTEGMVTLENILEELVGQIQDEFDQEQPLLQARGEGVWEIDGALPVHELEELLGRPIQEEGLSTVSGLVTQRLGGFPARGDSLMLGDHQLEVLQTSGPRVTRLRLTRPPN